MFKKLFNTWWKKVLTGCVLFSLIGIIGMILIVKHVKSTLPKLITIQDYEPRLVTQVYDRNGKKSGELYRERRILLPYDKIPKNLVNAFLAAEDDQFFHHKGINPFAILRATLANMRAGRSVQGGSTITQQVAKTILLGSNEKTLLRKVREALLAIQMEDNLSKEDILYLYLNQIYFGQGAYGVEVACETYFRKPCAKSSLAEFAILAGLPKAPSAFSPVINPSRSKERQAYVLRRMAEVGFVKPEEAEAAVKEPLKVYVRENFEQLAPFYLETVRQILVSKLGDEMVLDKGIKVQLAMDLPKQVSAQESVMAGLKELDKRQGFRGPIKTLTTKEDIEKFLKDSRASFVADTTPERTIVPDGKFAEIIPPEKTRDLVLPPYLKLGKSVEALVTDVDDNAGLVQVKIAETMGIIDFDSMRWARKPDAEKRYDLDTIKKPSQALKVGDVILVKIVGERFAADKDLVAKIAKRAGKVAMNFDRFLSVELDQEPGAEGALLSFDQETQDVLAMVGGYSFARNEFNRALQAARQTGSSFKAIVYASALDRGYTPSTPIMDAPLVYEESVKDEEGQDDVKVWKPSNHSKSFGGDIIFRNALVKSLNVPAVKIIEDLGVNWPTDYARRFGVFSQLNQDFTLALGSSSLTLYEMTKIFSQFGRNGKRIRPIVIKKVTDHAGKVLLENVSLDIRFEKELKELDEGFEERRKNYLANPTAFDSTEIKKVKSDKYFFASEDPEQLIRPQTAYVMTTLLKGVVEDKDGTGGRAKALGREVAGKTGTTNGYYDAWFMGFTAQIATGVWVGFDKEKSLGKGEVGGRAALPIWLQYMKDAHVDLPQMTLPVPSGIVFANIDRETGRLASSSSKQVLRQAYIEGTEPTTSSSQKEDATDFYKQDLEQ